MWVERVEPTALVYGWQRQSVIRLAQLVLFFHPLLLIGLLFYKLDVTTRHLRHGTIDLSLFLLVGRERYPLRCASSVETLALGNNLGKDRVRALLGHLLVSHGSSLSVA